MCTVQYIFFCFKSLVSTILLQGFPDSSTGEESACNAGDPGSIPELGRSPGGGHGNPLQCSCLENPRDRGAWQATVQGVARVRHDCATKPAPLWLHHRASQVAPVVKNPPVNADGVRDLGLILGWGRSPGRGHGNPLQCSCPENPRDGGTWWTAVRGWHGVRHD